MTSPDPSAIHAAAGTARINLARSSRIAVYAIRKYGDVGGPPLRGGPIPIGIVQM